jgi:hypothetical protein
MAAEVDIWRSAHALIKQHGADAPIYAAMKADKFLAAGDLDGSAVWKRIVQAINELMQEAPPKGTAVH